MLRIDLADPETARWLHQLRNDVNGAQMAVATALALLERGRAQDAMYHLDGAAVACERARELLVGPGGGH